MESKTIAIMDELLDVDDNKEFAMRLAYLVVSQDKFRNLSDIETEYRVESFRERVDGSKGKEKTRITIEF